MAVMLVYCAGTVRDILYSIKRLDMHEGVDSIPMGDCIEFAGQRASILHASHRIRFGSHS
jgi:hypothetical protein